MSGYLVAPSPLRAAVPTRSPDPVPGLFAGRGAGTRAGSRGVAPDSHHTTAPQPGTRVAYHVLGKC